jgi:hypothetical protein
LAGRRGGSILVADNLAVCDFPRAARKIADSVIDTYLAAAGKKCRRHIVIEEEFMSKASALAYIFARGYLRIGA